MKSGYRTFAVMIVVSMVVMYVVMYLNTYQLSDVRISEMRFYMTLLMVAPMVVIMLTFMRGMYSNRRANLAIYVGSVIVFVVTFFLMRTQILVGDIAYMDGMIPHHSIAILTSENAQIQDWRVRQVAEGIIESQRREIGEMTWLVNDIAEHGIASTQAEADSRPVPPFAPQP
jgi:hypothetical protein